MAKQNSSNQNFSNESDGFELSGGATERKLKVSGGDVELVGGSTDVDFTGGSTGDVLTQQSDGSLALEAPDAGGGVDTANSPNANEFARFTDADTIEGRTASEVKADLDLEIGTDVQAYDADLSTIAGLTATTDNFLQAKSSAWASRTPAQVAADLPAVVGDSGSGGTKGLVPAPGSGDAAAGKFLKADGTFAVPAGGGGSVRVRRVAFPYGTNTGFASSTSGNYQTSGGENGNFRIRTNSDNGSNRQSYGNSIINSFDPGIPYASLSGNWTFQMRIGCISTTSSTVTSGVFRYRVLATSLTDSNYISDTVKHITVKHLCAINGSAYTQDTLQVVVGNGSSAASTTLSGVSLATTFVNVRLEMTGGTSLAVYVDNTLKATITSGLPSFSSESLFLGGGSIEQSGSSNYTIHLNNVETEMEYA